MKKMRSFIFASLCVLFTMGFSQTKFEKEYRISEQFVPKNALAFIQESGLALPVKWYVEQSQEGKSYEAKTTDKKHRLSIEFSQEGWILDIEKKVRLAALGTHQEEVIRSALTRRFKKFKIKKIQAHWSGSKDELLKILQKGGPLDQTTHYEIVLRSKTDKEHYEVLLTKEGEFSSVLRMLTGNFDNLEY